MRVIQVTIAVLAATVVLLVLARILSLFGDVGRAELAILALPAVLVGLLAARSAKHLVSHR